MLFGKQAAAVLDRLAALEQFRRTLDTAIDAAGYAHVDLRDLVEMLDQRAQALRGMFAPTAPVDAEL